MYPVDMLKVRDSVGIRDNAGRCADSRVDEDASHQPRAYRDIHELHRQCSCYSIEGRGLQVVMEGTLQCYSGRRYISLAYTFSGARLTVTQDPRTPYTLHPTKPQNTPSVETREKAMSTTLLLQVRNVLETTSQEVLLTHHSCQWCRSYHHQRRADEPLRRFVALLSSR